MLGQLGASSFGYSISTSGTPSTTPGTSITPGSGSKGSYAGVLTALTYDCYLLELWISAGNTSTGIRDILVDIGIDPAGGTSYSQTGGVNNIFCPQASNAVDGGYFMLVPLFIPAGATVGARGQASSTATFRVWARAYGQPSQPHLIRAATYSETVGVSGNGGTPYTCGNTGAEGSWTSIGTTTRDCWHWLLCAGHNVGTTTAQMYYTELAYSGDATNYHIIVPDQPHHNPGTAEKTGATRYGFNWFVPAGGTLYVRGSASGTAETTEAVAVGFGG